MRLIIFPGGGNPESALYSKVYGLLVDRAPRFGYSSIDTSVRWPGHSMNSVASPDVLSFQGALAVADSVLEFNERAGEPYDILARSFGTYVALKATMTPSLPHLRRIILWGPPPFWKMWQLFVRDIQKTKETAAAKGLRVDETFFSTLEPVESLLQQTARNVVVATGSRDIYATPAFHSYLAAENPLRTLFFRPPVEGAVHEVTADLPEKVAEDFINVVLA